MLRADDARRCVDAGAAAVWVSNHGGRQLDRVGLDRGGAAGGRGGGAAARGARCFVDGGCARASTSLTALALGADAVFLGRLPLYALVDGGEAGVRRMHAELLLPDRRGDAPRWAAGRLADARGLAGPPTGPTGL